MPRSARRRWTRDLESEVDGVYLGSSGPIILHGYDPPAAGKWIDDVIPGKIGAFDRQSGERMWNSPCEVGYGRGFGAGFGEENDLIVLGPSQGGHRIVRMSLDSGELLLAESVPEFDWAIVEPDICVCVGPTRLTAIDTSMMVERWTYGAADLRFHRATRDGDVIFVTHSKKNSKVQGLLAIDAKRGRRIAEFAEPSQPAIEGITSEEGNLVVLASDLEALLPETQRRDFQLQRLLSEDEGNDFPTSGDGTVTGLVCFDVSDVRASTVRWFRALDAGPDGEEPGEASIAMDSGKVYVARGASLSVLDALSGRDLGEVVVPGLDEYVAWNVRDGAFLLAEETRASVYEIPD